MAIVRSRRKTLVKRKVSQEIQLPFYVKNVKRNEDLFQLQLQQKCLIAEVILDVEEINEVTPTLCVHIEKDDTCHIVRQVIEVGKNVIKVDHFASKNAILRFDFEQIDSIYQNVKGIKALIIARV